MTINVVPRLPPRPSCHAQATDPAGRAQPARLRHCGQLSIRTQNVVIAHFGPLPSLWDRRRLQRDVVDREVERSLIHARAHGRVALRVQIDEQHALFSLCQACGQKLTVVVVLPTPPFWLATQKTRARRPDAGSKVPAVTA